MKRILLFLFLPLFGFAQVDSLSKPVKPLKVGVVLSGGGAKGLAHIGVLKVLEEEGVQIDFIGGTSMGAMIGGLYAMGYTATELDSIFRVTDFDRIVQDNLPRKVKSFYEKENDEKYSLTLPFQKMKIGLPVAVSKGQNTFNLFSRLMYDARHIDDFSKLPIPFLCMATNAETGEMVLLDKGNLAQAVVASGTFPTLFSPTEINGNYLIDGGIVNNFPVDEIKKLGADIIIGVDVQTGLMDREGLTSAAKLIMQIINFQMLSTMEEKMKLTDIYIKPDITDFNVISFSEGEKIVENGIKAAEPFRGQFRAIAEQQEYKPKQSLVQKQHSNLQNISAIEIKGSPNYSRAYILGKLHLKPNDSLNFEKLNEGFNRLNATQNFRSISYSFKKTDEDNDKLILELRENPIKTFIRFGLHYDELYKSGLLVNLTHKRLLTRNDVISADLVLGDNFRYTVDYYVDNGFYWSFGFRSKFSQFQNNVPLNITQLFPIPSDLKNINVSYLDFTQQAYLQTLFKQVFVVGAGMEYKVIDINSETITINGQDFNNVFDSSNFLNLYGYTTLDTYDRKYFPKKGIYFDGYFKWVLNSTSLGTDFGRYSLAQGEFNYVTTLKDKFTFSLQNEMGFTLGDSDGMLDFMLGGYGFNSINGIRPFYGYDFMNIYGNSYIKGRVGVDVEVYRKNHLNFYANYANIGHNIFDKLDTWFYVPEYTGYAVGYGLETVIGPIELKYSWSPEGRKDFFWVNVGFWF